MDRFIHTTPERDIEPHFYTGTCPCNPNIQRINDDFISVAHHAWKEDGQGWINIETDSLTEQYLHTEDGEIIEV
jgi:hypothetical protein